MTPPPVFSPHCLRGDIDNDRAPLVAAHEHTLLDIFATTAQRVIDCATTITDRFPHSTSWKYTYGPRSVAATRHAATDKWGHGSTSRLTLHSDARFRLGG